MSVSFHFSGNQNGGTPRWYRILFNLALMSICVIMLVRTVPEQRLLVLPIFGLGIAFSGINLFRELRQIYKERAGEDDTPRRRSCPFCGRALQNDSEFCDGCGRKLPK